MDSTPEKKPNGKERTQFKPGNKAAAGHRGPGFRAQRKRELLDRLKIDPMLKGFDHQIKLAAKDRDALRFVLDYSGLRPVEERVELGALTLFAKLGIEVQGGKSDDSM